MSAGLNEQDHLAALRGRWDKAWPQGLPSEANDLHGDVALTLAATGEVRKPDLNPNLPV